MRRPKLTPFAGVALVYLIVVAIVGVYGFVIGGAGGDDLFAPMFYVAITLPSSTLIVLWFVSDEAGGNTRAYRDPGRGADPERRPSGTPPLYRPPDEGA